MFPEQVVGRLLHIDFLKRSRITASIHPFFPFVPLGATDSSQGSGAVA
jgi:hypothetical protein